MEKFGCGTLYQSSNLAKSAKCLSESNLSLFEHILAPFKKTSLLSDLSWLCSYIAYLIVC